VSGTPRIAYLATGPEAVLCQALYSIRSALAWRGGLPVSIHVYTDRPAYFAGLGEAVQPEPMDAARQRRWRGPWGFFYRLKPKVLEDMLQRHPSDPVLFLDADTHWTGDVGRALGRIGEGSAVMHEREYFVGTLGTPQIRNFRRRMRRATFRGQPVDVEAWMWNSGAVGLLPSHAPIVADWIDYLDEVHPWNRKPIVEQFALSWLLQRRVGSIAPCSDVVEHYWGDKDRHVAAIRGVLGRIRSLPPAEADALLRAGPLAIRGAPPERRRDGFFQRMRISLGQRVPLRRREA
jgi:hypothetical protein